MRIMQHTKEEGIERCCWRYVSYTIGCNALSSDTLPKPRTSTCRVKVLIFANEFCNSYKELLVLTFFSFRMVVSKSNQQNFVQKSIILETPKFRAYVQT